MGSFAAFAAENNFILFAPAAGSARTSSGSRSAGRGGGSKQSGSNRRRRRPSRGVKLLRFALMLLILLLAGVGVTYALTNKNAEGTFAYEQTDKFLEGISVNGIDISNLTYEEAKAKLAPLSEVALRNVNITIIHNECQWVLTAADLGASTTLESILYDAICLGRSGSVLENLDARSELKANGKNYTISVIPNAKKLESRVAAIAAAIDTEPIEPYALPQTDTTEPAFTFFEGVPGKVLDEPALINEITDRLSKSDYEFTLEPELDLLQPQKTLDQIKAVTKLRASMQTDFSKGSLKESNRVRNIQKTSEIINGCIVKAGEVWSLNEYVGPRTEAGGWALAPGIVNGNSYELQPGGGICQVSTTLYNALLKCGPEIEITTRKHHSWPSSYVPIGLDATVSTGGPDLAFKNNTGGDLYIFAYADKENYKMTIQIYGVPLPEGVSYEVYAKTDKEIEPPETQIIEEPTWPAGYEEVIINARKGYVATAYRDKLENGKVVSTEKLYVDDYAAVKGQKKVGTGDPSLPKPTTKG